MRPRFVVALLTLVAVAAAIVAFCFPDRVVEPTESERTSAPTASAAGETRQAARLPEARARGGRERSSAADESPREPLSGASVRGVVVEDGTDTPIAGALVRLIAPGASPGGIPSATTGDDGRFVISGLACGERALLVTKNGWCQTGLGLHGLYSMATAFGDSREEPAPETDPGVGPRVLIARADDVVERSIGLVRAAVLRGRVVTESGTPVAGAEVTARIAGGIDVPATDPFGGGAAETRTTDADGRFEIPSPVTHGNAMLVVKARGMLTTDSGAIEVLDDSPSETTVELQPGGRLEGRVTDASGAPVADAEVSLFVDMDTSDVGGVVIEPDIDFWMRFHTVSSTDGTYAFDSAPCGTLMVSSRHPRFVPTHKSGVVIAAGETARADLRMEQGRTIAGRVVRDDGRPLGTVRVDVEPVAEDTPPLFPSDGRLEPGEGGRFHIDCLSAAKYRLTVEGMESGVCEPLVVEAGARDVILRIQAGRSISGIVQFVGGGAVACAAVTATSMSASDGGFTTATGDDGRFEFEDLRAGAYELCVSPYTAGVFMPAGRSRPNIRIKRVPDVAAGTADLVIEVERGLTLTGRVRLADGSPASEGRVVVARIAAGAEAKTGSASEETDEFQVSANVRDGRFAVVGLDPGKVRVSVEVDGWIRRTLVADAGAQDVVFEMIHGGKIAGRVLNPDGEPVSRAWVRVVDDGDDPRQMGGTMSEADGTFLLENVAPGAHRVLASYDEKAGRFAFEGDVRGVDVRSEKTSEGAEIRLRRVP